jgi:hypothetical protein
LKQEFQELGEFVEAYRGRISSEGMLVRASTPQPAGTRLEVDIRLAEALPLVVGAAEIAGPSSRFSGGMVLRFLELEQQSRELIERLEAEFARDGVAPFRVAQEVAGPAAAPGDDTPLHARPPSSVTNVSPGDVPGRVRPAAAGGDDVYSVVAAALGDDTGSSRTGTIERDDANGSDGGGGGSVLRRVVAVVAVLVVIGLALTVAVVLMRGGSLLPGSGGQESVPAVPATPVVAPGPQPTASAPGPVEPTAEPSAPPVRATVPPAAPVATAVPRPSPASSSGGDSRATRVLAIEVADRAGSTVVTIATDGAFQPGGLRSSELEDPPRLVLELEGITEEYTPYTTAVGGPRLAAVRVWHYGDRQPPELRVVLDLAAAEVTVDAVRVVGEQVQVTLSGG